MFSMEKCLGSTPDDGAGLVGGGEGGAGAEASASDEVASAVAAVSDEIGDILKDELGDAARADRIDAELADLSAELGLLAGLAEGEPQQDFPSLFEIAMGHRSSGSGSSSSSWSGGRGGRVRRSSKQRAPRRRPIAKGKEMSRRRSLAARRAACVRLRRVEVVSDASDVGADSDSDDQWTELDDACTSDSSSVKEAARAGDVNCDYHKEPAEAPTLGQFLLPLLSDTPITEPFLVRHDDILQLLTSANENLRNMPMEEGDVDPNQDVSPEDLLSGDEAPTLEEEAAFLHFICGEGNSSSMEVRGFERVPDWLLGVYHSWCEIAALVYTLMGTNMSVEQVEGSWQYVSRGVCQCVCCVSSVAAPKRTNAMLATLLATLNTGGCGEAAGALARALALGAALHTDRWDLDALRHVHFTEDGVSILHDHMSRLCEYNDITRQIFTQICICQPYDKPMERQYAVERFFKFLHSYKAASMITFKVELIEDSPGACPWINEMSNRLQDYFASHEPHYTDQRLRHVRAKAHHHHLRDWAGYKHHCACLTPKMLCAQERKELLRSIYSRISYFGMVKAVNQFDPAKTEPSDDSNKQINELQPGPEELQQGDGTGAKPPDSSEAEAGASADLDADADDDADAEAIGDDNSDQSDSDDQSNDSPTGDLDDSSFLTVSSSIGSGRSSSLDSASELLLACAAAVDSAGDADVPHHLCRTVRHLMRSISSIERLMDRVLKHCDEWPSKSRGNDVEARKRVDMGLSEVDRKLMAMYRRLPEVHRRQLQVYRKQKKLSAVCMQLVGGVAPAPPAPGSPPPAPPQDVCPALCPEYHLQRFKEVRRKVMHMRDQQLYYHRLRMWLEDQLRRESESLPENTVTLIDELPRRKRRTLSPKFPRLTTATKRKLKPATITKPHKILQMLKQKTPAQTAELLTDSMKDDVKEADPPEAFPLQKDDVSDTDTIVGEKESDLCKDMKECLVKFANFALSPDKDDFVEDKYPEAVSPPLQEMSPTTSEPMPVYTPKPSQRLLTVNKFIKDDLDFKTTELNVPLNARRTPVLVEKDLKIETDTAEIVENKDPNIYKYVTFGLEIKKAMEECQNIINSYNCIKDNNEKCSKEENADGPLSLEQICEVMMSLDKNSAEFLDKMDEEPIDVNTANTKLAELVENMPQILANMPEIASEFANASFELPEFASIMNTLPDVNNEAQLTPETLKQIRELKLNKNRDSVKVTKNTAKRKLTRKMKNNLENDVVGTMTFEFDSKDISEIIKDEKEIQAIMRSKANVEDFKGIIYWISTQVVIRNVFEYLKQNKSPEIEKCLEVDKDLFTLPKHNFSSKMFSKAPTLFDNSVKDALSMADLRGIVKSKYNSCKHYLAARFKPVPLELLENEIESMLDKFTYSYIRDLAEKKNTKQTDNIVEKIEELRKYNDPEYYDTDEDCPASKESLRQITKLLSTSAGNTFDLLLIKMSRMSEDKKLAVKSLRFKYLDVLKRCTESHQLVVWILTDPDLAANIIQELMGFPVTVQEKQTDYSTVSIERKRDIFMERLRDINRHYVESIPKKNLSNDDWLVVLYSIEQLELKLRESIVRMAPVTKQPHVNASEAEILAAKGLSKIIGKSNIRPVKKPDPKPKIEEPKPKIEPKPPVKEEEKCKKSKNDALLARCEAILTSKGEKSLLDSFYTIKSYITQGLPVPEVYKKHVISICSIIDAKLLEEDLEENLKDEINDKDKLTPQNPEELAKYSAQALRNAKQTLNTVAFKNMARNGQSKSESDACDTPNTDCKWTNDCSCSTCKDNEGTDTKEDGKTKYVLEEKKKDVKVKTPAKTKPVPKVCENATHQQHVCKVGHTGNGTGSCTGEGGGDQHCTCCYCTVFGHAPPLTTPVPRNFNETRERLRSILNKKKQQCKTNGDQEATEKKQVAVQTQPAEPAKPKPAPPQPKPPALPKTLPPNLTAQAQAKRQAMDQQMLADKMAKMVVTDKTPQPTNKPKALQRTVPIQVNVPPALKTEGKVNPNAMEQIRLQQLKQQQQLQYQQHLQQQQAQLAAQQQQQQQQKKPEPIYDLPIHNKPVQQPPQNRQQAAPAQAAAAAPAPAAAQTQQAAAPAAGGRDWRTSASMSSRDTSVFSTSSGCSGGSCWRGSVGEDTRDLDALLEYIEGPARHKDRGKKKAKKQRQKAKKMEARLWAEVGALSVAACVAAREADALRAAHRAATRQLDDIKRNMTHHNQKKGKKHKLSPSQMAKMQHLADHLGELTTLINTSAKEVAAAEAAAAEATRRLRECEKELAEVRARVHGDGPLTQVEEQALRKHQQQQFQQQKQQLQQEIQQQQQQLQQQQLLEQKLAQQKQTQSSENGGGMVMVRRAAGGGVTLSVADCQPENRRVIQVNHDESQPQPQQQQKPAETQRKQTWEQALAHINQLAKGTKEKKKKQAQKNEVKQEVKPKEQKAPVKPEPEAPPLSKKQRKLLAKQQAEEEERQRQLELQQQELKNKKSKKENKVPEPVKVKQEDKKQKEQKKQEIKTKKEESKEDKKEKKKEKEKEKEKKKAEPKPTKQKQPPTPAPAQLQPQTEKKKDKKKDTKLANQQVVNITPHTTIEVVNKKNQSTTEPEKPASCSIMEQLSCGVQVADLKLPPGITLTRVQPNEKKEPAPIKSVPLWKCGQLPATPTPVARPPPVINADPSMMMFSTQHPEAPKTIIIPEPPPPPPPAVATKSKKSKKKAKKGLEITPEPPKPDGTKMVTLRNPMFHPNLPPVQISPAPTVQKKTEQIRVPDPIPMPPNACQATITPTSNGMYTIRNPLMSMMHQQSLMGLRNPSPQMPMYNQPYNYVNPNYSSVPGQYVLDPSNSPKTDEYQSRIMNLASFTQKNDEGYSLFKTNEDTSQRSFLSPEYYENTSPKPVVSPNPIGTRPSNDTNRFENDNSSLFSNPIQRPEPIGTPLKTEDRSDYTLYTPFGQEDRNVFRNALFNDKTETKEEPLANGDSLPYFQRLRVGSKLNNEVTIHHVTESKFYRQDGNQLDVGVGDDSLFSRPAAHGWDPMYPNRNINHKQSLVSGRSSPLSPAGRAGPTGPSGPAGPSAPAGPTPDTRFGPVGAPPHSHDHESSVFLPDSTITNLSSLEACEREIESFKRFEWYFSPPEHKPKVQLHVTDIANSLKQHK